MSSSIELIDHTMFIPFSTINFNEPGSIFIGFNAYLPPYTPITPYSINIELGDAMFNNEYSSFSAVQGYPFTYPSVAGTSNNIDNGRDISITKMSQYQTNIYRINFKFSNLIANAPYRVTITVNPGAANETVLSLNTISTGPNKPQNVTVRGTDQSIYMRWDTPTGPIMPTNYKIYKTVGYLPILFATIPATTNSYTITGLENGTTYNVAVFADAGNVGGTYLDPADLKPVIPQPVPSTPVLQGSTDTSGQIILSWNASTIPTGMSISDYFIYSRVNNQDARGSLGLVTTVTLNTPGFFGILFPYGQAHSFYISAVATNGAESLPSNTVSVTPLVTDPAQALAGGQSIESFVASSTQSAADIALSTILAVKGRTYASPEEKAAAITAAFTALKNKIRTQNPTATTIDLSGISAADISTLLTEQVTDLPEKPVKFIIDSNVSISSLGSNLESSYIYFNLPQRFILGSRWIQFATDYTYTTSESAMPISVNLNERAEAGGLIVNFFGKGTVHGSIIKKFTATYTTRTDTTAIYNLAGVDSNDIPSTVSVTATAGSLPVYQGWQSGSSSTVTINGTITGNVLTLSGLSPNTVYRFTISADGYDPVEIGVNTDSLSYMITYGPPIIRTQPVSGTTGSFSVVIANDTPTVTYQWKHNGISITGEENSSYSTNTGLNGDRYFVVVSNIYGEITSSEAILTVIPPPSNNNLSCFLADAPVLTPAGYRPIASLSVGDHVITSDGRSVAICNIKVMRCAASPTSNPYIIPRGIYGATKDLLISPRHRVAIGGGQMVEARNIGLKQAKMKGIITYYNLELPNWNTDNMIVAGVEVESLASIRRIEITKAEFTTLLKAKYGKLTPDVIARATRTCFMTADGKVNIPIIKR